MPQTTPNTHPLALRSTVSPPILPCSFLHPTLLVSPSYPARSFLPFADPVGTPGASMTHSLPPPLSLTPPLLTSSLTNGLSSLCSLPQSSFSSLAYTTTLTLHSPLISLSPIDPVGTPGASMTPFLPHFPFLTLTVRPSTLDPRPPTLDPRTSTLDLRPSTFDPRLSTLDPRSSTLDPRPSTLDLQPLPLVPPQGAPLSYTPNPTPSLLLLPPPTFTVTSTLTLTPLSL